MSDENIRVGDWVRHPEFGDGLVLEAKGAGDSASVVVSFPDKTHRRLMIKFARLSRLEPQPGTKRDAEAGDGGAKRRPSTRKAKGA